MTCPRENVSGSTEDRPQDIRKIDSRKPSIASVSNIQRIWQYEKFLVRETPDVSHAGQAPGGNAGFTSYAPPSYSHFFGQLRAGACRQRAKSRHSHDSARPATTPWRRLPSQYSETPKPPQKTRMRSTSIDMAPAASDDGSISSRRASTGTDGAHDRAGRSHGATGHQQSGPAPVAAIKRPAPRNRVMAHLA